MELHLVTGFTMIVFLNAISPGPNLALVLRSLSYSGSAHAYSNVVGFSFGWLLHVALLALGISQAITNSKSVFMGIKFVGATYLCWIGVKALIRSWKGEQVIKDRVGIAFPTTYAAGCREGFITSSINPQTFMFLLAVFPQFISGNFSSHQFMLIMILIFICVSTTWFCFIVWLFDSFEKLKQNTMLFRCTGALSGISLISIAVIFMTTSRS